MIAVAPDPEITRHWARLLSELFKDATPGLRCEPALTNIEALRETGCQWYEFGDLDIVCEGCGAVGWESCCCVSNVVRRNQ